MYFCVAGLLTRILLVNESFVSLRGLHIYLKYNKVVSAQATVRLLFKMKVYSVLMKFTLTIAHINSLRLFLE